MQSGRSRTVSRAAREILSRNLKAVAAETNTCLCGIEIVDPKTSEKAASYASALYELRKAKGMTEEEAARKVQDPMFYGVMMVKMGDADGLVSGAIHSTGDMLRPALQIIKCKPGIKTVSSCFMMESPIEEYGVMIFSDCAVIPNPTAEELANIAVAAAESARTLAGIEPKVAMLSFSTKGSAKHDNVTKVQEATRLARELAPELKLDGELQGMPTCSCSPTCRRATSAISSCSASARPRPTAPSFRASPSPATI